jgi:hypothetical protein
VPASAEARERTVAAARAATPPRRRPRRRFLAAGTACVLGLALASPPGQAAIEQVGELVGIGEVGDPPTLGPERGTIVDNGRAPDGTGYEWNVYPSADGRCLRLDWPGRGEIMGGTSCAPFPDSTALRQGDYISSHDVRRLPSGDVIVYGTTRRGPRSLEIVYTDADGARAPLAVDFALIEGGPAIGVFTAFVPAEQARRDRLTERFRDLSLIFPKYLGPEPTPDPSQPPECFYVAPPGPFEFRFRDANGELLATVPTIVGRFAPPGCRP